MFDLFHGAPVEKAGWNISISANAGYVYSIVVFWLSGGKEPGHSRRCGQVRGLRMALEDRDIRLPDLDKWGDSMGRRYA